MRQVDTKYLRADRTIEKYISNHGKIVFIYNNQGLFFDVFFSEQKMKDFFDRKIERGDLFFDDEKLLDKHFNFN